MARSITAPVQHQDFADWTGCSLPVARSILLSRRCPSCNSDQAGPDAEVSASCTDLWHLRNDSGEWA